MLNSFAARRLLRSQLLATQQRTMSALLVPLAKKDQLPFEVRTTQQTDAELALLEKDFKAFNLRCSEELKEMNANRITNLIDRGGVQDWETAADFSSLKKSFQFASAA
jgi:hypothetical protein